MSKQARRDARPAKPVRRSGRTSRRRRTSSGVNPLVWVGGILVIVVMLAGFSFQQSGAFADPPAPSRSEGPADHFPLTAAKRPLKGGHDMQIIPKQTPAPQVAPEGVALAELDLPSTNHDFGRIPKRPNVAHVYAVQNTGSADLKIWNLVTSCGCTTATLSSSVIPPGERADLTVTFDPDFHVTQGDVVRLVWFATNDPTQPWAEVRFNAAVD